MTSQINAQRGARSGLLMILLAAMLWGTVGVFVQAIYTSTFTNPLSIAFLRLAISVPVLLLACMQTLGWRMFAIARRDLLLMLLIGAMTAFYQVCYFAAIAQIGVAAATLIALCTAPVWVALLASLLLGERLTLGIFWAGVCAIGGTVLLVNLQSDQGTTHYWGIALALGSAIAYAIVALSGRLLASRYHPLQSLTISFMAASALLLPIVCTAGFVIHYSFVNWMSLLYLGIITTALAYSLYFSGMRHTPATIATIATLLEPLTSTVLATWLLRERLSASGGVGATLLLVAIALLYWQNSRWHQRHIS